MNNTYTLFKIPQMSIAPLCTVPFSVTDLVYNPACYYDAFNAHLADFLRLYNAFNLALLKAIINTADNYTLPVIYGVTLGFIVVGILKILYLEDTDEPLSPLESEITQYIHANASTGCTVRMLYECLDGFYEDGRVEIKEINKALQKLKKRGIVLPVPSTLWVVSGN